MNLSHKIEQINVITATYDHERGLCYNGESHLQGYALSWLHLTNNAREYPDMIIKFENTPSDTIYVYTRQKHTESVQEYLNDIGFIVSDVSITSCIFVDEIWSCADFDDKRFDNGLIIAHE